MYEKISRTKEILANLPDVLRDPKEDLRKMLEMNAYMEEVHRDYLYKEAMSERSASELILNS